MNFAKYLNNVLKKYLKWLASEWIYDNWKPFKNDEKPFLFQVKSSFRSWDVFILLFLILLFLIFGIGRKTAW